MADSLYLNILQNMEAALRVCERKVPPPQRVPFGDSFVYRYVEQSIHQALVQKLARVVSGLHAATLLLEHGFPQEQAALHRILDELQEDVHFLCHAIISNEVTDLHRAYLQAFYEEEFDNPEDPVASTQKRPMVHRKKIRAYLARCKESPLDPSRGIELSRTLSKTYSGFVHAASPQIMDMYGGNPPVFHVAGMFGTPRLEEHAEDLWNYFFRGILAFALAALAFGDEALSQSIRHYAHQFEEQSGRRI